MLPKVVLFFFKDSPDIRTCVVLIYRSQYYIQENPKTTRGNCADHKALLQQCHWVICCMPINSLTCFKYWGLEMVQIPFLFIEQSSYLYLRSSNGLLHKPLLFFLQLWWKTLHAQQWRWHVLKKLMQQQAKYPSMLNGEWTIHPDYWMPSRVTRH